MRVFILMFFSVLLIQSARSESLSAADREALLENLEKLSDTADSKVDARFRIALTAFRNAMGSDEAAIELYLNCMERVNFEEEKRKPADFREWKRKEAEKISNPAMRLALRHQLRWLILTLEASNEKADRVRLAEDAQQALDSIFRDAEKLAAQDDLLEQAVTASVFARAYDINHVKVENWPLSPIELEKVYDEILMPPYRKATRVEELRSIWIKRIQQESAKVEYWSGNRRDDRRGGVESNGSQSPEFAKFLEAGLPRLQWEMEVDLFKHGDESGASMRMLSHLEKYLAHPSAREWGNQLKELLKPPAPAAAPPTVEAEGDDTP